MGQKKDAHALAQPLLDELYQLYAKAEANDKEPALDQRQQLRDAYRAIQIWWELYGVLMVWAQNRIFSHEMSLASSKMRAKLAKLGFDEDISISEFFRTVRSSSWPDRPEKRPPPEIKQGMREEALRKIIVRLMASNDLFSGIWREPLRDALRAVNAGETYPLFQSRTRRRRGRPYRLDLARSVAVAHVYYLTGQGFKKHVALDSVANEIAVDSETLRSWEKSLSQDSQHQALWAGAYIAGDLVKGGYVDITRHEISAEKHDFEPDGPNDYAIRFLVRFHDRWSLEEIRDRLKRFHSD